MPDVQQKTCRIGIRKREQKAKDSETLGVV